MEVQALDPVATVATTFLVDKDKPPARVALSLELTSPVATAATTSLVDSNLPVGVVLALAMARVTLEAPVEVAPEGAMVDPILDPTRVVTALVEVVPMEMDLEVAILEMDLEVAILVVDLVAVDLVEMAPAEVDLAVVVEVDSLLVEEELLLPFLPPIPTSSCRLLPSLER